MRSRSAAYDWRLMRRIRLAAICHDAALEIGSFGLRAFRPIVLRNCGVQAISNIVESLLHLASKPGVMFGRLVYLPLAHGRIGAFALHGGRIMVGHVDFEPGKAEFVANIGGRGV